MLCGSEAKLLAEALPTATRQEEEARLVSMTPHTQTHTHTIYTHTQYTCIWRMPACCNDSVYSSCGFKKKSSHTMPIFPLAVFRQLCPVSEPASEITPGTSSLPAHFPLPVSWFSAQIKETTTPVVAEKLHIGSIIHV